MRKQSAVVARILKLGTLISTFGFIGSTLIQIFARFLLESAPSWTEEAARFFFIYAICFAAGLAMKDNYYVYLDLVYNKLKESQKKILDLAISFFNLILFLVLGIYAIPFVMMAVTEKSPSLRMSMSLAFASIVVMALSVGFYAFLSLLKKLRKHQ
ncbi:TRAP transporter small permease subunit [Fulvivirgaceae bacterium BMA12]|uniref:TRAP transporter small permease subunit n=1 Tax=Agaribacillus aureus TaxID=3051825 RepID=A0ABT8LH09_9BACT|nr:TRAP transporter small permease subunit [Fulvivirgaceae bacterium BMA12]